MNITDWYAREAKYGILITYVSADREYVAGLQVYCTTLDKVILQHVN